MRSAATTLHPSRTATLADWERLATDAVGTIIEFWGFKLNHGRVWALLYLRGASLDAAEIRDTLGLSKGAVSMVTHELERWGVIHRLRAPGEDVWRFRAETELLRMIGRVVADREARMVSRVEAQLAAAERQARADGVPRESLVRLRGLSAVAAATRLAIDGFLATFRFDARAVAKLLVSEAGRRLRGGRRSP